MNNRNGSNGEVNGPSERKHVGRRAEGREEIQFWFYQRIDMEVFHVVSIVVSRLLHAKWYFSRGAKQFSFGCLFVCCVCECIPHNMCTSCDAPKCENCGSSAALSSPHRNQYVRFSASSASKANGVISIFFIKLNFDFCVVYFFHFVATSLMLLLSQICRPYRLWLRYLRHYLRLGYFVCYLKTRALVTVGVVAVGTIIIIWWHFFKFSFDYVVCVSSSRELSTRLRRHRCGLFSSTNSL